MVGDSLGYRVNSSLTGREVLHTIFIESVELVYRLNTDRSVYSLKYFLNFFEDSTETTYGVHQCMINKCSCTYDIELLFVFCKGFLPNYWLL